MAENSNLTIIRSARPEDMEEILQMTADIFEQEQGIDRKHNPISEDLFPRWWCMEKDHRIVGAIAAWIEDNGVNIGRFVIRPEYRGQHLGLELMRVALYSLFTQGVEFVRGGARDTTMHILEKFGAKANGETVVFFGSNITPFILYREDYEKAASDCSCCSKNKNCSSCSDHCDSESSCQKDCSEK